MISAAALAQGAALTVTSTPGTLRSQIGDGAADVTELTVNGAVDASDLEFVNYELKALRTLDLSGATIASYTGDRLASGRTASRADMVPDYAFTGSPAISIILPASVKEIGEGAFAASAITDITIPSGVTSIGTSAFADCNALTAIKLPDALTTLGKGAFRGCTSLTRAELGSALAVVPERAFAGCGKLATVTFPAALREIGSMAFYGTALENLTVSKCPELRTVGDWAFAASPKLKNIYLPSAPLELGKGTFFSNEVLEADLSALVKGVDSIPSYAFAGNCSMKVTKFEDTYLKEIGDYSLRGLSAVDTITLPASLEYIGTEAMSGWAGLTTMDARLLGEKVPELGRDVWQGIAQSDVALVVTTPQSMIFSATPQWQNFAMKILDPTAIEGITADAQGATVSGYISGDLLTLESQGADILGFQLYDLQGRMIAIPQAAPAQTVTVGLDGAGTSVVVVRVLLADSTVAVLKLAR